MTREPAVPKIDLPPRLDPKPVAEAAKAYLDLRERHRRGQQDLTELEFARDRAREEDRQAHADAIRQGKPDPGDQATLRAQEASKVRSREVEALRTAAVDAHHELVDVIERHRSTWSEKVRDRIEKRRTEVRKAIDQLDRAARELREDQTLVGWLRDFPNARYKSATGTVPTNA